MTFNIFLYFSFSFLIISSGYITSQLLFKYNKSLPFWVNILGSLGKYWNELGFIGFITIIWPLIMVLLPFSILGKLLDNFFKNIEAAALLVEGYKLRLEYKDTYVSRKFDTTHSDNDEGKLSIVDNNH